MKHFVRIVKASVSGDMHAGSFAQISLGGDNRPEAGIRLSTGLESILKSGFAITLKYRHDHIEDAVLIYSSRECAVFLLVDGQEESWTFVKLTFEGALCVRSARTDCSPAIGIYPEEQDKSFLVELTDSEWPVEAHRKYVYQDSPLKPRGRHFVISTHDVFHEILADSFSELLVELGHPEYESIKRHFQN